MQATLELILEQVRGVWRFRWIAMLVAWVVCLIGWLVVLALSDTYSAWAQVHIDTHTRLSRIAKGIWDDSDLARETAAVREALLGGPQLEKVARVAIPAYAKSSPAQQRRIVEGLRKRLLIDANGGEASAQPPDLYTISYIDQDRATALRVVDQLLRLFLANSLGDHQKKAQQAQQFLKQQIDEYEKKLQAAEARLADFKRQHEGLLPGATGDYLSRLQAAKEELQKLHLALQLAERRRDELKRQLADEAAASAATPGGSGLTETEAQIRLLKAQLRELLRRFTESHPDVIEVRRALAELEAQQRAENAALMRGDRTAIAASCLGANPVHQGTCLQLSQANIEVSKTKQDVQNQEAKIDELTRMIRTVQQVEAEYASLNRDYDTTHSQYLALVDQLNRVQLEDKAEATGAVARFEVFQPATVSDAPVSPDRPRLILAVLLGGIGAGLAVAYFLHQLRPVFTSPRELGEITKVPVLGIVSMNSIERHVARERRARWAYAAATAVLVLVTGIVLLIQSPTSQLLHGLMA